MALWDPKSYVSQAVGSSHMERNIHSGKSYYEYLMSLSHIYEQSKDIEQRLAEQSNTCTTYSLAVGSVGCSLSSKNPIPQNDEELLHSFCSNSMNGHPGLSRFMESVAVFLGTYCVKEKHSVDDSKLYEEEGYIIYFLMSEFIKEFQGNPLLARAMLNCGDAYCTMSGVWEVGVKAVPIVEGESSKYYKMLTLDTSNGPACFTHFSFTSVQGQHKIAVNVFANSVVCLCALSVFCSLTSPDASELADVLSVLCAKGIVGDFYCYGQDGYEFCKDMLDENGEEASHDPTHCTQLFNLNAHKEKVVKEANTADAFHILGLEHSAALHMKTVKALLTLPNFCVSCTCSVRQQHIFSQMLRYFQFLNKEKNMASFTIPICSPLYNNTFEKGSHVLLTFCPEATWTKEIVWSSASQSDSIEVDGQLYRIPLFLKCGKHALFTTTETHAMGDCIIVIGSVTSEPSGSQGVLVSSNGIAVAADSYLVCLCICSMIHQQYGAVGFLGYSCCLSSNFPPTVAVCLSNECSSLLREEQVDPNVTVRFFSRNPFATVTTFSEAISNLPFPISKISSQAEDTFAVVLRTRLIKIFTPTDTECIICILAVTDVEHDSSPAFSCVLKIS